MLTVQRQLKDGTTKNYHYETINGQSVNDYMREYNRDYMRERMRNKRAQERLEKGRPPLQRVKDIPIEIQEQVIEMRNNGQRFTDIAKLFSISPGVARGIYVTSQQN